MNMNVLIPETLRYLGIANGAADDTLYTLVTNALMRVEHAASKRFVFRRLPCVVADENVVLDNIHIVKSADLAKHLSECREVVVFAATLGVGVDRLLRRDTLSHPTLAVAEQAAAAAILEAYCDEICTQLEKQMSKEYLRPRFSAGYGDFPLSEQRYILRLLDANKRIGLSCTDSLMLIPIKSVTAIIGISSGQSACYANRCDGCAKTDCEFRK